MDSHNNINYQSRPNKCAIYLADAFVGCCRTLTTQARRTEGITVTMDQQVGVGAVVAVTLCPHSEGGLRGGLWLWLWLGAQAYYDQMKARSSARGAGLGFSGGPANGFSGGPPPPPGPPGMRPPAPPGTGAPPPPPPAAASPPRRAGYQPLPATALVRPHTPNTCIR